MTNQNYYISLTALLSKTGWSKEPQGNGTMDTWSHTKHPINISLPNSEFAEDEHAPILYDRAVKILARLANKQPENIIAMLDNFIIGADLISVREIGQAIEHGKINLFSGSKSLAAIAALLKECANKHVTAKRGFKQKLEEHYLNSLKLVVPGAGSFIHRIEVDLQPLAVDKENDVEENIELEAVPANRAINVRFAKLLLAIRDIDPNKMTVAKLMQLGVNEQISKYLIDTFSEESDQVEYNFTWSPSYEDPPIDTNTITFNRAHRETLKKVRAAFANAISFPIEDVDAHIEDYSTPKDKESGLVLRMELEGRHRTCHVFAERKVVEELMKDMSKDSLKPVTVSGTVTRETRNKQNLYTLSEATISPSKTKQLPLIG
ncbi:hypothetical protein VA249_29690 [Vibrio alfacsensis]|nr:hypothetical protein VA249_29690 [Vibrio alfacsensis]